MKPLIMPGLVPPKRRLPSWVSGVALLVMIPVAVALWQAKSQGDKVLQGADIGTLQAVTKREPDNARAFFYLGKKLQESGNPQTAFDTLAHAADLAPSDADIWEAAAQSARVVQGDQAAFNVLGAFVKANPQSIDGHLALSRLYARNKSWQRGLEEAQTARKLDDTNAEAHRLYGFNAAGSAMHTDAEAAYRRAIALDGADWHGYQGVGDALMGQGKFADALPFYRKSVELASETEPAPRLALGHALLRATADLRSLSEAETLLQKAAALRPATYPAHLFLGQCFAAQRKWAQAESSLKTAMQIAPHVPDAYFELAQVYQKQNKMALALAERTRHQAVLKKRNEFSETRLRLAELVAQGKNVSENRLKIARLLTQNGEYEDAVRQYSLLLSDPNLHETARREQVAAQKSIRQSEFARRSTDALMHEGERLYDSKQFVEAADTFVALLRRDKNNAAAYEGAGLSLLAAKQRDIALFYFMEAATRDKRRFRAQQFLGEYYAGIGIMREAERRLKIVTQAEPQNSSAWHCLGMALRDKEGAEAEATAALTKAAKLVPHNSEYLLDVAEAQESDNRFAEAETTFRQALKSNSSSQAQARFGIFLAKTAATHEKQQEARGLLRSALSQNPNDDVARFYLGRFLLDRGDVHEAIFLFEKVLQNPANRDAKEVWYSLSRAYRKSGNVDKAKDAETMSVALEKAFVAHEQAQEQVLQKPGDPIRRLTLARSFAKRGEIIRAVYEYDALLRLDSTNRAAQVERASLRNDLGASGGDTAIRFNTRLINEAGHK